MKIQSRKLEKTKAQMSALEIINFLRNILEIEGHGNGDYYKKVLTLGALAMLKEQKIIVDYQVRIDIAIGCYNIWVQVRMPDNSCEQLFV